jgi:hypothetical protein
MSALGLKYRGSQMFEEIYMAVILKVLSSKCHEILTSYMVCFKPEGCEAYLLWRDNGSRIFVSA